MKKWLCVLFALLILTGCAQSVKEQSTLENIQPTPSITPTVAPTPKPTAMPTAIPTPKPTPQKEQILTITRVTFADMTTMGEVFAVDENGDEIILPADYAKWFEAGAIENIMMPKGMKISITGEGLSLSDEAGNYLEVDVRIDDSLYMFKLGTGSAFHYKRLSDGIVNLVVDDAFTKK